MASPQVTPPPTRAWRLAWGDFVLSGLILLGATAGIRGTFRHPPGNSASLSVHGQLVRQFPLNRPAEYAIPVDGRPLGVEVREGRIRFVHADCPRRICQQQGYISLPGQTVVCLPRQAILTIDRNQDTNAPDAVSY